MCVCPYVVVAGLRGAENGGVRGAAEFRERVRDGRQRRWAQLLLFPKKPAGGDKRTRQSLARADLMCVEEKETNYTKKAFNQHPWPPVKSYI